ncbi:MAG: Outer membrane protein beta-barrel domain [Marinobacter sp. HL-58]|nr:DcaP family trimeric outer membrane transporter [Marinobacter sp. HL-58]KPQ03119.1 MAG: Outer membrane protein beta-barrel domain [Marinobacter sp. HL-58]
MQSNKLRMAIRSTAAVAILGVAGHAHALTLDVGDDVEASLYGFARLNMSYDFDGDRAVSTRAGSFTPADEDVTGHFGADAQQSRIGVKTTHSSGASITVEGDFRGTGNAAGSLRIRHAYGEYKGLMAGRNWSNYNSFVGNTAVLDFDGLAGTAGAQDRTEQVRYTTGAMSFSLEDPLSQSILDTAGTDGVSDDSRTSMPVFTARIEDSADGLSYSAAALVGQVTADNGDDDDSVISYGVFGAAKFALTDMISVQGALNYSDGATGYLWRSGSNYTGASAYLDGDSVESIEGYGGSVGMGFDMGGGRSVNVGYGMTKLDLDDAVDAGQTTTAAAEMNQNVMVNYMWTPVQNVMMGVEYAYLDQETIAGDSTDANRVMFAAQYNF